MDPTTKEKIEILFLQLQIDVTRDAELARGYFILSLIRALTGGQGSTHSCIRSSEFQNYLCRFSIAFFCPFDEISDEDVTAIDTLLALFQKHSLYDHRTFFEVFSPFIVADWEDFAAQFCDISGTGVMLATLCYLLIVHEETAATENDPLVDWADIYRSSDSIEHHWAKVLGFDAEKFLLCWEAVFAHKHGNFKTKINGRISNAIEKYRARFVPLERLLEDYYLIKKCGKEIEAAVNPWAYVQKGVHKIPVETDVSVAETLFDLAAYPMRDEAPTDVIRSLFYPKSSNDSAFECSFLYAQFRSLVTTYDQHASILIVHPSPDFILKWIADRTVSICVTTYFAVPNQVFADLYRSQFPEEHFLPFSEIPALSPVDFVLLTSRNIPVADMESLLLALEVCANQARVLALLPNTLFDSNAHHIHERLQQNQFQIVRLLLLPSTAFASSPRKKVLFYFKRERNASSPQSFPAYAMACWADGDYCIFKERWHIRQDALFNSGLTIRSLFSQSVREKNRPKPSVEQERRAPAECYVFSKEICIYYIIMANRKNRFAGKAYYCESNIAAGSSRKRGRRLTEIIEKGLRAHTETEVIQRIETVPFDPRVEPYIVSDLCAAYAGRMNELSLKSLWFCCRPKLLKNREYREEIATRLFCGDAQALSNLRPEQAAISDFCAGMEQLFGYEAKSIQLIFWRQLNLVLQTAMRNSYIRFHPISQFLRELSAQATEEQREVRNALMKKTFTAAEEMDMLEFLSGEITPAPGASPAKRYVAQSIWLAGAIRLFTGMPVREVCGLKWKNFVQIQGTDAYQFHVTKFVNEDGSLVEHLAKGDLKRLRRVPLASVLAVMLLERYAYLETRFPGLSFKEHPIVLLKEHQKISAKEVPGFSKPRRVSEKCKEMIAAAHIPEQILLLPDAENQVLTDIFKYQGDIFQSNFKYRANHTCALTWGEINYLLGLEPPDTFSRHYCDYTNDLIQYAISKKLQRWVSDCPLLASFFPEQALGRDNCRPGSIAPIQGGIASADVLLKVDSPDGKCTVDLSVDCNFGYECSVIFFREVDYDDTSRH